MFTTAASDEVRLELRRTRCPVIDFFDLHMQSVESILQARGVRLPARLHGVGDIQRYNNRMQAIEYTIEHDDGQRVRGLEKADVILVAVSANAVLVLQSMTSYPTVSLLVPTRPGALDKAHADRLHALRDSEPDPVARTPDLWR